MMLCSSPLPIPYPSLPLPLAPSLFPLLVLARPDQRRRALAETGKEESRPRLFLIAVTSAYWGCGVGGGGGLDKRQTGDRR
ncbi:hypothetical protein E2C01_088575 [Portunus trituberculatus]|uniref:Uncharacterized protein n=1 Tax=Portunus trituberculatus TaxID=210409 RepID=A0A5B7JK94_PORTR|nr:hypothetical protein [Portunus trituberculatus]